MHFKSAADLLRAPQFTEPLIDKGPCLIRKSRAVLTGPHAGLRELMGLLGPLAALSAIAAKLTADGGSVPIHHTGNLALVMSVFGQDGNLIPFVSGEMCLGHSRLL